jgi:putative zinc finger/helix-turn-helix YgiT family protein
MNDTRCPICSKGLLKKEISEFRSDFEDDQGRRHDVVVPDVVKFRCDSCGEYILDSAAESRISAVQRAEMGLLSATDLQRFRNKLGKSQEAIASLLGLGKKTWCRWESNDHFQSEAFDRFLRLLIEVPSNVEMLELIRTQKQEGATVGTRSDPGVFTFLARLEVTQECEKEFTAMLTTGKAFTT